MGLGRIGYLHGFASMMKIERVDVIGIAQVWPRADFGLAARRIAAFMAIRERHLCQQGEPLFSATISHIEAA